MGYSTNFIFGGSIYWKDAVATLASLPASGNIVGELRQTIDTSTIYRWSGSAWVYFSAVGGVSGPASSTDNAISRFNGTTGKVVQDSGVIIDDSDNVTGINDLTLDGDLTVNGTTTTLNTATVDSEDPNITLNKGGDDASSEDAGLTIERTGTDGSLIYEDALTTKFKLGAVGSEVEITDISSSQTLTNKSLNADDNPISELEVDNFKSGVVVTTIDSGSVDTELPTAKAVYDNLIEMTTVLSEPTGFPNTTDSSISFVNGTRTFTIEPAVSTFDYYIKGIKYTKSGAENIVIPDTEGIHFIYYDGSTLTTNTTAPADLLTAKALITEIYWDATNNVSIYIGEERHSLIMDGATHLYLHNTRGTQFLSGLGLSNFTIDDSGNVDAHAQFDSALGSIADEDITLSIAATTVGSSDIPIFYKDGAGGDWRLDAPNGFAVKSFVGGSSLVAWNEFTGGSWQQTETVNNRYILAHIFATNDTTYGLAAIQGQATYLSLNAARVGASDEINDLVTAGLPFAEFTPVGSIIFQTSTSYGNAVQARIRSTDLGDNYVDFRGEGISPSANPSDHGNLTGLNDDDHSQYALLAGRSSDVMLIDTINEQTGDAGVTIDSVLLKDNEVTATNLIANTAVQTDSIIEKTGDAGVTVDSVLLKDNEVTATNLIANTAVQTDSIIEKTGDAGVTIDLVLLKDNEVTATNLIANTAVQTDSIIEKIGDAGVTIDTVLLKDGGITLNSGVAVNSILDEDAMGSDSATALCTQQSIKAYVDTNVRDLNIVAINSNTNAVDGTTYLVDANGGVVEVTLPTPTLNAFVTIKDKGDSNTNNITVVRNGSEDIDEVAASYVIDSDYGSITFVADGTDWWIL